MNKLLLIFIVLNFTGLAAYPTPPYRGTVWVDPDIITDEDPTSFKKLVKAGKGKRKMHDRRVEGWVTLKAHLFDAYFDDQKKSIEVQVNPEFDANTALEEARKYLNVIGQIPVSLRKDVQTVWIHKGDRPFGGGNNNLQIHTAQGEKYISKGLLAEVFLHEATHTSLDPRYRNSKQWLDAQKKDETFISNYARDHPNREDLAESFPLYLALRYKPDRIDDKTKDLIAKTIPNRIAFLDTLALDLGPFFIPGQKKPKAALPPEKLRKSWDEIKDFAQWQIKEFKGWGVPFDGGSKVFFFETVSGGRFDVMAASPPYWTAENKKNREQVFFVIFNDRFYLLEPGGNEEAELVSMIEKARPGLSGNGKKDPKHLDNLVERIRNRKPLFKIK